MILSSVVATMLAASVSANSTPREAENLNFRTTSQYGEVVDASGQVYGLKHAYHDYFKIGMSFMNSRLLKNPPVWVGKNALALFVVPQNVAHVFGCGFCIVYILE